MLLPSAKSLPNNHKRVYRIYRELELNLRINSKRGLKRDKPEDLAELLQINTMWSMDLLHDSLTDGSSFRTFNVLADYNTKELGIVVDKSLTALKMIRALDQIIE